MAKFWRRCRKPASGMSRLWKYHDGAKSGSMTEFVIEGPEYEETRKRLMEDPIVIEMAKEVGNYDVLKLTHAGGELRFGFMIKANEEYAERLVKSGRGEDFPRHLGAVAEAILRLNNCTCHHENTDSHELCCGHEDGRDPNCPIHGDGSRQC